MTNLIDGRAFAREVHVETSVRVSNLLQRGIRPGLLFIRVGEDPASQVYVGMKERKAAELGIHSETRVLPSTTSEPELLALLDEANQDPRWHGILVQAPVPAGIEATRVFANGDHANPPQAMCIEQNIRAMGNKVVERQLNRPPLRVGHEALAIRLPRPGQGVRPQMNAVLLTIAENVEFDPVPGAGIDDPAIGREIEGDLNKAAIVLEADVAEHADGGPAGDCSADQGPF